MLVLFLLHHCVESGLKEVIRMSHRVGNLQDKSTRDLPGTHSLTKLLGIAEENLAEIDSEQPLLEDQEFKELVEDLEDFGSYGEGLRYPETLPGKNKGSEATISAYYVAEVGSVIDGVKRIRGRMNGCIGWLGEYYEGTLEFRRPG